MGHKTLSFCLWPKITKTWLYFQTWYIYMIVTCLFVNLTRMEFWSFIPKDFIQEKRSFTWNTQFAETFSKKKKNSFCSWVLELQKPATLTQTQCFWWFDVAKILHYAWYIPKFPLRTDNSLQSCCNIYGVTRMSQKMPLWCMIIKFIDLLIKQICF